MNRLVIPLIIIATIPGCAVYTGASVVSLAVTDKSLTEHAASQATQSDCSTVNYLFKGRDYLCEQRDIAKTYNRNPF